MAAIHRQTALIELFEANVDVIIDYLSATSYKHQIMMILHDGFRDELDDINANDESYRLCLNKINKAIALDKEKTEKAKKVNQIIHNLKKKSRELRKENKLLKQRVIELELSPYPGPRFMEAQERAQSSGMKF